MFWWDVLYAIGAVVGGIVGACVFLFALACLGKLFV